MTSLGVNAFVGTLNYKKLEPAVRSIEKRFPVKTGKTITKDAVVMLNNSGEIYPIEFTGSIPLELPVGQEHIWGVGTNPQNPTNTHFVAEKEFIINLEAANAGTQVIGGSVDSAGVFTYGASIIINTTNNPYSVASAIDGSTYGQPTVSGISLSFFNNGTFATAFTYDRATKTFTKGSVLQTGLVGGTNTGLAITSIDAGRYIVSSAADKDVYLLTVSGTTIIKTTTLPVPNSVRGSAITKISNTKVVVLYLKNNRKTVAQIVDISGATLSLGNLATSTYENFGSDFLATPILSLAGKFYPTNMISSGGFAQNFGLYEYSYNAGTDTISINNTPIIEPTANFNATDLAYYQPTNRIIASGSFDNNPAVVIIDFDNSTFAEQTLDFNGNGNSGSSAIDEDGDIVVVYNDMNNGASIYGQIGNILSNLDPTKRLGVAAESGSVSVGVSLAGSVATLSSGSLTPNGSVFVSQQGVICGTTSFDAINIGKAISSNEYLLN
jgi:hypothetical protein